MDVGLIIYFAIVVVLIVLAFKFIKKIIFAVITSIMILSISVLGIVGLVFLDFQSLTQMEDATINVAYLQDEEYSTGVVLPINSNQEVEISEVNTLDQEQYQQELDSTSKNTFTITFNESVFSIIEDGSISLNDLLADQASSFSNQDLEIEVEELIEILNSNSAKEDLAQILLDRINISPEMEDLARPSVLNSLEGLETSRGLDIDSIALLILLNEFTQKESNIIAVFMQYQDGNIEIHPNKFSFTLLKYIPVSLVRDSIMNSFNKSNEMSE